MPEGALEELLNRASATATSEPESFQSVMFWKYVTANFYALEEKIAMGPFNPHMKKQLIIIKPQIPDLNKPAPENEGFIQVLINEYSLCYNAIYIDVYIQFRQYVFQRPTI